MSMLVNILIGCAIFGYAGYALYKSVKKQKAGKCGSCALQKHCSTKSMQPGCSSTYKGEINKGKK
ncbi:MAG: FeoB-associated Cys-rich membrane protein [Bacillus sp. (in: firmicutes)]